MINPWIYFLVFLKATLLSTGGPGSIPILHQDIISNGWANEIQFGQAISIGQFSPGPTGLWVISLGYFTYGFWGAIFALVAVTLPPLLVLVVAVGYKRIENQEWVSSMMRGISLAVIGMSLTVAWSINNRPGVDWRSWLISAVALGLAASRRVHILIILALAGAMGYLIYR
ncbi:MAG: chromate transporter [Chloroflexi bacterium]|nr:chromate transporter [Chloroflexota bacterium]